MKVRIRRLALFFAALGLLTAPASSYQNPPRDSGLPLSEEGSSVISGRVVTSAGQTLHRVNVMLSSRDLTRTWRAITDGSGRFEFKGLPAGAYTLSASHPQYLVAEYGQAFVGQTGRSIHLSGNESARADLVAVRGGAVTGRILDDFGYPASDIAVQVYRVVQEGARQRLVPVTARTYRSNDIGQYRVSNLPPGDYYLVAQPGGSAAAPLDATRPEAFAPTWYPGTLFADGARSIRVMPDNEVSGADFQLQIATLTSITGTITVPDGRRPAGVRLQLLPADSSLDLPMKPPAAVDPAGNFRIERVAPGNYILLAQMGSEPQWQGGGSSGAKRADNEHVQYHARIPLAVTSQPTEGVTLSLALGATISGRIEADAVLPSESRIIVSSSDIDGQLSGGSTSPVNEQRRFSLSSGPGLIRLVVSGLPTGWIVESIRSGGQEIGGTGLRFGAYDVSDVLVTLSSRSGEVSGNVSTGAGAPAGDYTVVLMSTDPTLRTSWGGGVRTARPDQRGWFSLNGLRAGAYVVAAVEYIAPTQYYDPLIWKKLEAVGERITLSKGEARQLSLRLTGLTK